MTVDLRGVIQYNVGSISYSPGDGIGIRVRLKI